MSRDPARLFFWSGLLWHASMRAYWVSLVVRLTVELRLASLELVLLGTAMELALLLAEVPTGVLADRFSRKWSVVTGFVVVGAAQAAAGLVAAFPALVATQILWGVGYTFRSGADTAWVTDELGGPAAVEALLLRRGRWQLAVSVVAIGAGAGLARLTSLSSAVVLAGGLMAATGFALALLMPEHHRPQRRAAAGSSSVPLPAPPRAAAGSSSVPVPPPVAAGSTPVPVPPPVTAGSTSVPRPEVSPPDHHLVAEGAAPGQAGLVAYPGARLVLTSPSPRGVVGILGDGARITLTNRSLRILAVTLVLAGLASEAVDRLDIRRLDDLGLSDRYDEVLVVGLIAATEALLGAAVLWWAGRRLTGPRVVTGLATLLAASALGIAALGLLDVLPLAVLGLVGQGGLRAAAAPLWLTWANAHAPSEVRATVHSFVEQAGAVGEITGGVMLGAVAALTTVPIALTCSVVLILAAAVTATRARPHHGHGTVSSLAWWPPNAP